MKTPPPTPSLALLSETVEELIVIVPSWLVMPPPLTLLGPLAVLPEMVEKLIVIVAPTKFTAPAPKLPPLPDTVEELSVSMPSLEMPPPPERSVPFVMVRPDMVTVPLLTVNTDPPAPLTVVLEAPAPAMVSELRDEAEMLSLSV